MQTRKPVNEEMRSIYEGGRRDADAKARERGNAKHLREQHARCRHLYDIYEHKEGIT